MKHCRIVQIDPYACMVTTSLTIDLKHTHPHINMNINLYIYTHSIQEIKLPNLKNQMQENEIEREIDRERMSFIESQIIAKYSFPILKLSRSLDVLINHTDRT